MKNLVALLFTSFGALLPVHAEFSHGLSNFGDLKYLKDFRHFDYVNPNAPKGGRMAINALTEMTSFDSFNNFILRGDPAVGLEYVYDSLMVRAQDEPDAVYGLIASGAEVAPDRMSVTFELRTEAMFADGSLVTADDVLYTFETLKSKGHPKYSMSFRDVVSAKATAPNRVRFEFKGQNVRSLPVALAMMPILPRAHYSKRPFEESNLDLPMGSGPYAVRDFKAGTFVSYKRRADYWARNLPVNRGRFNFDEIRFEYFRDMAPSLEAFKAGEYDYREEGSSKNWATAYDFPAVLDGRVIKHEIPDQTPSGAQGFFMNLRREKFSDIRVRRALDMAFDFEFTNKNIFYMAYKRTQSYFENSELKAVGKPSAEELAMLEPFRDKLPKEVFGDVYIPPESDGTGKDRKLLRQAGQLLTDAGWELREGRRVNKKGENLDIEFIVGDGYERILLGYVRSLQAIGVNASIRRVDSAQMQNRLKSFDFDIVSRRYAFSNVPGFELFNSFGSAAAKVEGSDNIAGISDLVADALIGRIVGAKSKGEMIAAGRALDRVLRAGNYWISAWYINHYRSAIWNKYGRPEKSPLYDAGIIDTWFSEQRDPRFK